MRQASALPQLALALISLAIFALVPLSLAYTLAQCGFQEDALNAIANLGGMVMSFLGGAWAPLSLMGPGVQAMARFTPPPTGCTTPSRRHWERRPSLLMYSQP